MRNVSTPLVPRQRHLLPAAVRIPAEPSGAPARGPVGCGWCGTPVREVPWHPESSLRAVGGLVRLRCLLGHWSLSRT